MRWLGSPVRTRQLISTRRREACLVSCRKALVVSSRTNVETDADATLPHLDGRLLAEVRFENVLSRTNYDFGLIRH